MEIIILIILMCCFPEVFAVLLGIALFLACSAVVLGVIFIIISQL